MISSKIKKGVCLTVLMLILIVGYLSRNKIELGLMRTVEFFTEKMEDDKGVIIPTKITDPEVKIRDVIVKPFNTMRNLKKGYCFIGEDSGIRYCAKVDSGDLCKSNEMYDKKEVCKHPELRY